MQTPVPRPVLDASGFSQVSVGYHHACGIKPGDGAYCWGFNQLGTLGDGVTKFSLVPVKVAGQP